MNQLKKAFWDVFPIYLKYDVKWLRGGEYSGYNGMRVCLFGVSE